MIIAENGVTSVRNSINGRCFKYVFLSLVYIAISASPAIGQSVGQVHPTKESISPNGVLFRQVIGTETDLTDNALVGVANSLRDMEEVLLLGVMDGEDHEMFGSIADVGADADRNIYVLDSRNSQIRIFSEDGVFINDFGAHGRGPMEFQDPLEFELIEPHRITVLDRFLIAKEFDILDKMSIKLFRTWKLPFSASGMCLIPDGMFVQGPNTSAGYADLGDDIVHAIRSDGAIEYAFGTAYQSENPLVRVQLSRGRIACSENGEKIVVMLQSLPLIHAFSKDGSLMWVSKIADFKPRGLKEITDNGQIGVQPMPHEEWDYADTVIGVTFLTESYFLIQIRRYLSKKVRARGDIGIHSYLVSIDSGKGMYVGKTLPMIHSASGEFLYASIDRKSFPQVVVYRWMR